MKRKFQISNFKFLIFVFILLIASFFRLYRLNQVPPSPSLDEVSIGYNAYSILKTGRDEYGTKFPVLLRAYDDWRPALYVYLVIPFVKLFGLSVAAVRLPAVLLSLVAIVATYFLVVELFSGNRPTSEEVDYATTSQEGLRFTYLVSLITAFLLAISPWHIYISRLGHEVNAGLAFSVLGILFFLKWLHFSTSVYWRKIGWLLGAVIFLTISFYTYQSIKIFIPSILITLGLIFRKPLTKSKKEVFLASLLGIVLLIPIIRASLSPEALIRFRATNIFFHQDEVDQRVSLRVARDYQKNNLLGLVFDNRKVATGLVVLRAYFSHFNPTWLFFNQGQEKHKVPGLGVFYLWELPLLLIGSYQLAKGKFSQQSKLLIFSWLLISPLPASIATEAPHVMRTFNILPMPQILGAIGLVVLGRNLIEDTSEARRVGGRGGRLNVSEAMTPLRWTWREKGKFIMTLVVFLLLSSLAFLFHNYFTNFPHEQSESFQYALAQSMNEVLKIEDDYEKIIFSNQDHCYQSYMFWLFFAKFDPEVYLAEGGTVSGGFAETHAFEKYEFRPINWEKEKKRPGTLYVGNLDDFPIGVVPLETFRYLDGKQAIGIVEP